MLSVRSRFYLFGQLTLVFGLAARTMAQSTQVSDEKYINGSISVALITTPNNESAKKLAHLLVGQKLAACVNIVPQITSIYIWEENVNEDQESLMIIKTRTNRIDELTKFVRENHPYSVAEVISLPVENGNLPYLNWVLKSVPNKD